MVDSTLYDKDLLCRNCIRYLAISKIVYSHTIQIHCSNTIIVRLVTTVFAGKQVYLLGTVSLFNVPADRTTLTCIAGVNLDDCRLSLFCSSQNYRCSTPDGKVKTFSRGGSDITGSIVSRAARVDLYENWTDVSGFLVADPRIIDNPEPIETITYRELRELSYMGASVLHEDAIFPVRREGIPINIKNTNAPEDPGTWIVESTCQKSKYVITGIAGKKGFCSVNIDKAKMNSEIGFCRKVLGVFEDNGISIEHMPSGIDTMTVFVHQDEFMDKEQQVVSGIHRMTHPDSIDIEADLALIAVVGRGMRSTRGTAGRIFASLAHANINVKMIDQGSSELNIIIGVTNSDFEAAIKAIYDIFVSASL